MLLIETCDRPSHHVILRCVAALTLASVLLLGACATIPESMRVRSGVDPRNQDDKVRFRTTYYFRVFDACRDRINATINGTPQLDSLYRFRMTGKASGLFTQVRFESGILHKTEIDPFSASVVFDDKLGRHRFVSREATDAAARRHRQYDEIRRHLDLLKELDHFVNKKQPAGRDSTAKETVKQIITKIGDSIEEQIASLVDVTDSTSAQGDEQPDDSKAAVCSEGTELQRGFQVMGPEGVATFSKDHRLILAMTTSGKPLIGALKALSGRILQENASSSEVLLPLVRENLAVLRAIGALDGLENDPDVPTDELPDRIIATLNQEAP